MFMQSCDFSQRNDAFASSQNGPVTLRRLRYGLGSAHRRTCWKNGSKRQQQRCAPRLLAVQVLAASAAPPSGTAAAASPAKQGPLGEALLILQGVSKSHDGERDLFSSVTLTVHRGERLALVGPNGAGKSSLLRILAGADEPDSGSSVLRKGVSVGYLAQEPEFDPEWSALEAVMQAESTAAKAVRQFQRATAAAATDSTAVEALAEATAAMDTVGGWELASSAASMLEELGIQDPSAKVSDMSGGQRRRVALAGALMASPDLLVLDEPTNHLDLAAIRWLERALVAKGLGLVMVTHDRSFMEQVCTGILELEAGTTVLHGFGGPGSYEQYRDAREERRRAMESAAANARTVLRKESEWMRRQPKARSVKAKSRVDAFYELTAAARNVPKAEVQVTFAGAPGSSGMSRQGSKVMQLEGLCYEGPGGGKTILRDFWYEFEPGERLGVVGHNGAGKTTLLKIITGKLQATGGKREVGETTVIGHLTQAVEPVPEHLTLINYLREVADVATKARTASYVPGREEAPALELPEKVLDRVGFPRSRGHQQVGLLSGGERRRLQLAAVLQAAPNLLVLDEPTNDLDLGAVEALEDLLASYKGCLLVASHDRRLMSGLAQRLLVLRGDGVVRLFDGDYDEYTELIEEEQRQKRQQQQRPKDASPPSSRPSTNGSGSSSSNTSEDSSSSKAQAATAGAGAAATSAPKKLLRLGYRERQEYESLEDVIDKLSAEKDALAAAVMDTASSGGYSDAAAMSEKLALLEAQIDKKTERWLELAERADIP